MLKHMEGSVMISPEAQDPGQLSLFAPGSYVGYYPLFPNFPLLLKTYSLLGHAGRRRDLGDRNS